MTIASLPSIGVVIPSYRCADSIARTVLSVLGQANVAVEIVVVVDDRCDRTRAIVERIGDVRVRVVMNAANMGAQASRNAGLALLTSPSCMFLDGDDFLTGDMLAPLAGALVGEGADIAFGPWLWWDEARNICRRTVPAFKSPAHAFDIWLTRRQWVPPCAVLWRTDYVRGIGGWDETVQRNQDGEIVLRGLLKGAGIAQSARGAGVYYQHDSADRITASRANYASLMAVADKLLALESAVVPAFARRRVIGRYLYAMASNAFRRGQPEFGRDALRRSRELGFRGTHGSRAARMGMCLLGLERYHRIRTRLRRCVKSR